MPDYLRCSLGSKRARKHSRSPLRSDQQSSKHLGNLFPANTTDTSNSGLKARAPEGAFLWLGAGQHKPIAIDRSDVRKSLHQVRDQGKASLKHRVWVLIFPEGTRIAPGKLGKFSRGGAGLAHAAESNILPIAHNAGVYWPMDSWIKKPGTIKVSIGPVINAAELSVAEANDQARDWIENQLQG